MIRCLKILDTQRLQGLFGSANLDLAVSASTLYTSASPNVRAFNAKTNLPRLIPMTLRVYEELLKLCEKNPGGHLFGGLKEVKRSFGTACG